MTNEKKSVNTITSSLMGLSSGSLNNRLSRSDQNVIMYASRLFENQSSLNGINNRTYFITINVPSRMIT